MTCVKSILLYISCFVLLQSSVQCDIIVNTNSGKVEGKEVKSILENEKYYSFYGIPYAKPPVEELRFMPPQAHPGWEGVLRCTARRPECAQYLAPSRAVPRYGFTGDEDCLHLTIHTPQLQSQPDLPVIVFIQNEYMRMTNNATAEYLPDFFANEGVIIAIVNHRLGSLGFLSFEDDLLPGNNGLRDVIMALEWMKENVHNFGGDPSRVTLMGSQGGSVVVDFLLHSPKAKGLFNGAILQSGTSWSSSYLDKYGKRRAKDLARVLQIGASSSANLIGNLADIPASDIVDAEIRSVNADEARELQRGVNPFSPIVEHDHPDAVIVTSPENSKDIDVPIMIGYNSREALDMCERYMTKPEFLTYAERDFLLIFPVRTDYQFQINGKSYNKAIDDIKRFYFDEGYVKVSKLGEYMNYIEDIMQFYAVDYTVRQYANASKAPVYYYTFDYSGDLNYRKKQNLEGARTFDGTWGASVTDELCYLFICKPIKDDYVKALGEKDSEELGVLKNMVRLWTNFAKTGNPTPPGAEFTWSPATADNKECLLINEGLQMRSRLHQPRVQFWDDFIDKYRKMARNGVVREPKDEL